VSRTFTWAPLTAVARGLPVLVKRS
jgi:hypothetical protein